MVEASGESIPHQTRALTAGEVGNLADRLLSRAVSTVFADEPAADTARLSAREG
jgi:hypothetical protein